VSKLFTPTKVGPSPPEHQRPLRPTGRRAVEERLAIHNDTPQRDQNRMYKISRLHSHLVFAVLQCGLTSAVATAIANMSMQSEFILGACLRSWLVAWLTMVPVVLLAAPMIRRVADYATR
jgi:hypothetical protein